MDDRELLELAARAAAVPAYWSVDGTLQNRPMFVVKAGGKMGTMPYESEWNPLKDDAEALRMAVKLCMGVIHNDPRGQRLYVSADASRFVDPIFEAFTATEEFDTEDDRPAATRRAIVRAAAGIARQESSHDS